jgi:chromosome partitioning protein
LEHSGSALVVASSKGGCGKTTLSTCLAVNLAGLGYRVAAVDADRNQALATWYKTAGAPSLTCTSCISQDEIVGHVMAQTETHDVVLIDTAGFENQTAIFAMGAADMVLIPVMPDRNSVLEARKTARQLVSVSQIARRPIAYRCLLSRWNPRGLAERATLEDLEAMELQSLKQHLPELSAFKKATFGGELPRSGAIGLTIDRIIDELRGLGVIAKPTERAA